MKNTIIVDATSAKRRDVAEKEKLRSNFAEMEHKVFGKVKNTIIVDATSAKRREVAEEELTQRPPRGETLLRRRRC